MRQLLRKLLLSIQGATLAEYGLLIALIAVACIAAVTLFGANIVTKLYDPAGAI